MKLYHCARTMIANPPPVYRTATSDQTRLLPLRGLEFPKSDLDDTNPLLRLVRIAATTIRIDQWNPFRLEPLWIIPFPN